MDNRDFAVAMLERLYSISGILDNSLHVVRESEGLDDRPPATYCMAVGMVLGAIHEVLNPTWKEYPDLAKQWLGDSGGASYENAWDSFNPADGILESHPADVSWLHRDTAIRVLSLYESCHFQLNFLVHSAEKHGVPEFKKLKEAITIIVSSLFNNLVKPLWKSFPDLEEQSDIITSKDWLIPLRPNPSFNSDPTGTGSFHVS